MSQSCSILTRLRLQLTVPLFVQLKKCKHFLKMLTFIRIRFILFPITFLSPENLYFSFIFIVFSLHIYQVEEGADFFSGCSQKGWLRLHNTTQKSDALAMSHHSKMSSYIHYTLVNHTINKNLKTWANVCIAKAVSELR